MAAVFILAPPDDRKQIVSSEAPVTYESAGIAAIIVDYYSADHTVPLAASLDQDKNITEIIVVDNSGDPQYSIGGLPAQIRIVKSQRRQGYGAGINQGVTFTSASYVLALNSDLSVARGQLSALADYLSENSRVGLVAPLILNRHGIAQADAGGRMPRRWGSPPDDREWRTGAAFMMRRQDFERVAGFDERYFMYWEDTDLCLRLHNDGLDVATDHSVAVTHAAGGTDRFVSSRYRNAAASRDQFLRRWSYPVVQRVALRMVSYAKVLSIRVRGQ